MPSSPPTSLTVTLLEGRFVPTAVVAVKGPTSAPPAVTSVDIQSPSLAAKPILVGANATTGEAVYSITVMPTRPPCHCAACMAAARAAAQALNPDVTAAALGTLTTAPLTATATLGAGPATSSPVSNVGNTSGLAAVGTPDVPNEDRPDRIATTAEAPRPAAAWADPFDLVVPVDAAWPVFGEL